MLQTSPPETAPHAALSPATIATMRPALVTIRAAKPRDLAGLGDMIAALARHHGDSATMTVAALERDLFGPSPWIAALVAEADGKLIGYAILAPLYRGFEGLRGMELHHLYVALDHRGTGIGRHLVAKCREHVRLGGGSYLSVSAATGNFQAHRFYEAEGFKAGPVTGMRYIQTLV